MKVCVACGSDLLVEIDGYKHKWELCRKCRCARSIKKERYALEPIAPFLRKYLQHKQWFQTERRLLRDKTIASNSEREFDYFLNSDHIEFSKKHAQWFYDYIFQGRNLSCIDKDILEISGGGGDFVHYFLSKGAKSVALSEFHKKAVEQAQQRLQIPAFHYDINSQTLSEAISQLGEDSRDMHFDYIIMRGTIMWCHDPKKFLSEVALHLKKGGKVIIDDIQLATLGLIMHLQFSEYAYLRNYSPEFLEELLISIGFNVIHKEQKASNSMVHAWFDRYPLERWVRFYYEQKALRRLQFAPEEFTRLEFNARDIRDWLIIAEKQ